MYIHAQGPNIGKRINHIVFLRNLNCEIVNQSTDNTMAKKKQKKKQEYIHQLHYHLQFTWNNSNREIKID